MNRITKGGKQYIGYKYKRIFILADEANIYIDGYKNFGWELDGEFNPLKHQGFITLVFKKDRKLLNQMELTRLERHFEACVEEINTLKGSKASTATAVSIAVGILGAAFITGAVFAFTNAPPKIFPGILLSIPGLVGMISSTLIYNELYKRSEKRIEPLIEQKYDEIYDICEKGFHLLNK